MGGACRRDILVCASSLAGREDMGSTRVACLFIVNYNVCDLTRVMSFFFLSQLSLSPY